MTTEEIKPTEMTDEEREALTNKAIGILTEEVPEITNEPVSSGYDAIPKRWKMGETLLDLELSDAMFSGYGKEGETHHTYIDGVDIGSVLQGIQINADINGVNKIILHMIGLPMRVRMLGVVEIESKGADKIADEYMARAEEAERQRLAAALEREGQADRRGFSAVDPDSDVPDAHD